MMRKFLLHIALLLPLFIQAQAPIGSIPVFRPAAFDAAAVAAEDAQRELEGELPLYSRNLPLGISSSQGAWHQEGDERVCRMAIASPGALAMELMLEEVEVPEGARLRVIDRAGHELHGFVAMALPGGVREHSTPLVEGDAWVLEYREPIAAVQGRFAVAQAGHAYRDVREGSEREGPCHVNVACQPESNGWEGPIRATVRISVVTAQGNGWCTGTLVNNVRQDCAPYILTAWHCGRTSTAAQFNQYKFYFNFQYAQCVGGAYSTAQYMTGAQLKAYSDDYAPQYQGLGGSDFMLLRTNAPVPDAFAPYWAGWDAQSIATVTADGVCIHHPSSAPKRISSFTQTVTTGHPMASSGLMSHYRVKWASTQNGFGVTEIGSSGAGMFTPHATLGPLLVGTLTGSSSGMSCTNNTGTSYFGKMSYHWTNNPNAAHVKLKPWLDPDNSGTLAVGGSADPCGAAVGVAERPAEDREPALFPNPATGQVSIETGAPGTTAYMLTDIAGQVMRTGEWTGPKGTIDLAGLASGGYLVRLLLADRNGPSTHLLIVH